MNGDEYNAALNGAALFAIANTGFVEAKGPDAASFLNNVSTNDIVNLPVGGYGQTFLCDHRAKTLFAADVRRVSANDFILSTAAGYGDKLLKHLDRYLISEAVELTDATPSLAMLHLAGPMSGTITNNTNIIYFRRDRLGVEGYDIYCDAPSQTQIANTLEVAGAVAASPETFNVLRIEAGTPIYGIDIDETRFVMEVANAARAVCYTKGCFIGQEPIVMSRDRAGQVNRLFLGLKVLDGGPLAHGTKLTKDGTEVGIVTSSCISPRLGSPLALGYVKRPHIEKGTRLMAGEQAVEVLGYPPLPL